MIGNWLAGNGPVSLMVASVALISTAGMVSVAAQPTETVVAEIPEGRSVATDLYIRRPMIDFSKVVFWAIIFIIWRKRREMKSGST